MRAEVRRGGVPRPPVLFGSYGDAVLADLAAEHAALDAVVAPLDDATWERPTPAEGWTIVDCVAHLRHFDGRAALAATDPDRFVAELGEEGRLVAATHRRAHEGGGTQLLEDWRAEGSMKGVELRK